jgi:crossover junction endonuclease EME1
VKSRYDHTRKAWIPLDDPRWEWEGTILVIITADECVDMIHTKGLREWASDVRLAMGMKGNDQLMIMIKGLAKYYTKLKSAQNKEYTAAARAGVAGKDVGGLSMGEKLGREQIDMELLRLEMENGAFLVHGKSADVCS